MHYSYAESQSDLESESNFSALYNRASVRRGRSKSGSGRFGRSGSVKNRDSEISYGEYVNKRGGSVRRSRHVASDQEIGGGVGVIATTGPNVVSLSRLRGGGDNFSDKYNQDVYSNRSSYSSKSKSSKYNTSSADSSPCSDCDGETTTSSSGEPNLPYPGFPEISLRYLTQDTKPRNWCLLLITNPYPFYKYIYV